MNHSVDKFDPVRDFYNDEYYSDPRKSRTLPWHCRRIGLRLGDVSGRQVLDVACGTGEWLGWFRSRGAAISGIDLSSKAIEICRRQFPDGEFHSGPAESLPFEDCRFDLVTCMGSLEHFLDKAGALQEMRRVAKPGARFLILVPNAGFLTRRLGLYRGTEQTKVREDVLALDDWERLLRSAGLHVISRWRDLHPLSWDWISLGSPLAWPFRALQALALTLWPTGWQYQVYHYCEAADE